MAQKLFSRHKKKAVSVTPVDAEQSLDSGTTETVGAGGRRVDETGGVRELDIYNLEGGIFQWACEQREIVNDKGEKVNTVHPYNPLWGKLLPAQVRHKI